MFDSSCDGHGPGGPIGDGAWLVDRRHIMEQGEIGWLDHLAAFDTARGYATDGQLSCAAWLQWRCRMCRSTAFEKLRVAHALQRRPLIHDAFAAGIISYSAARLILGLHDPDPEVDQALINLAAIGTVDDVARAVRHHELLADQDNPKDPYDRFNRRGIRIRRGLNGYGAVEIVLELTEIDEIEAALQAYIDPHPAQSARPDTQRTAGTDGAADLDTDRGDSTTESAGPDSHGINGTDFHIIDPTPWWVRRADAFMALCRTALAHAHHGQAAGTDRYMIHLVHDITTHHNHTLDGIPIPQPILERIACDATYITHTTTHGQPLNLGRKTRSWTPTQRRAITVRDGGQCRFPGCTNRHGDIHHIQHWTNNGPTNIDNGAFLCNRHHTLIHTGYDITGDANHTLTFHRPHQHGIIATTVPPAQLC